MYGDNQDSNGDGGRGGDDAIEGFAPEEHKEKGIDQFFLWIPLIRVNFMDISVSDVICHEIK